MTSLIIVLTLLVGIMIYSQISSNKEAVRNREYEKEREIRKQETEKKIFEILEKSKRYFESNKFNECIVELDKLNEFNATDRAKNLRIQCQLGLKEFVKVSNISPPYTDEMLYFKVIALLEIKNYDQAMELIPLGFKRKNHEKFIVLFHQYINPLNDFNLFWRYLDRNSNVATDRLREAVAAVTNRPTTFGWGPRFLHSTGQYHKGGPRTGVYIQLVSPAEQDVAVPGRDFTRSEEHTSELQSH